MIGNLARISWIFSGLWTAGLGEPVSCGTVEQAKAQLP